ncbi:MAG: 16S rRNA (cytosine(967)-C(5))-methyltransferase RsmB [Defluviitaleaceae bacterium]|nr:16S rRNA (cytosine(967)-C(5))-methyltransferase RsmB [Defluviitaleaceae bacterium]
MTVLNAREIAVLTLSTILEESGYNNIVLNQSLNKYNDISPMDRAMVTEIVNGTLRNLILIDHIISLHSKTPVKRPYIRNLLRISVYQLIFMDKVPDSAVCNEAVRIAKAKGLGGLSGYVNGVLRNAARNKGNWQLPDRGKNLAEYLSVFYSHPKWLIKYWLSFMNEDKVAALCESNNISPTAILSVNTEKITVEALEALLEDEGVKTWKPGHKNAIKVKGTGDISRLESFKNGYYHIMDINAMKAVDLINPVPEDLLIDLCAAPGGKSFYAANLMSNRGEILSLDIHEHKLNLIAEGVKRLGFSIIKESLNDAAVFNENYADKWDKVMLDVPCSGLGVLAKKPDARYKKSMKDIDSLVKIQRAMLLASYRYPKIGGRLLYSTCTISIKENEENIAWFLEKFPYKIEKELTMLPVSNEGTDIDIDIGDGFYAVSMIRCE